MISFSTTASISLHPSFRFVFHCLFHQPFIALRIKTELQIGLASCDGVICILFVGILFWGLLFFHFASILLLHPLERLSYCVL